MAIMNENIKIRIEKRCFVFFLVFLLVACSGQDAKRDEPVPDAGFHLERKWAYQADKKIEAISANHDVIALAIDDKIVAVSVENGSLLWDLPFKVDKRFSPYLLAGGEIIVATNAEEMIAINSRTGQILWEAQATDKNPFGFKVNHVSENYVVAERTASWNLEVYDAKTGEMLWDTFGDRGGAGVYVDEPRNLLLVVGGPASPRMFDLEKGKLLSQQDRYYTAASFAYEFPFVYYTRNEEEIAVTVGGLDLRNMEEKWSFYVGHKIYQLTLAGDMLLVSSEDGLYVLSKDGVLLWKADGNDLGEGINEKALGIGENIFATTNNTGKIYAWKIDGQQIGALSFPGKGGLKQIFGTEVSIASANGLLLVIHDDVLYVYSP